MILEIAWQLVWEWLGAASASHRGGPGSSSCLPWAVFLPLPLYYSSLLYFPSPSVGFLQPPGSEQYQMPQSPSPCSPSQMPQQFSGKTIKIARVEGLEGRQKSGVVFKDSVTPSGRKTKILAGVFQGCWSWSLKKGEVGCPIPIPGQPHVWLVHCFLSFVFCFSFSEFIITFITCVWDMKCLPLSCTYSSYDSFLSFFPSWECE